MALILMQPDAGSLLVFLSFSIVLFREGLPGAILLFGFVTGALFFMSLLVTDKLYIIGSIIAIGFLLFPFYTKKYKENRCRVTKFWRSRAHYLGCYVFYS